MDNIVINWLNFTCISAVPVDKFIDYEQGIRSGERKKVTKGMRDEER